MSLSVRELHRVCDFINVWEKVYEGTVSGGTQEINELK